MQKDETVMRTLPGFELKGKYPLPVRNKPK